MEVEGAREGRKGGMERTYPVRLESRQIQTLPHTVSGESCGEWQSGRYLGGSAGRPGSQL